MNTRSSRLRRLMLGALALGLLAGIGMTARAASPGHGGGGHGGQHGSAGHAQAYRAPRMPRPAAVRNNANVSRPRASAVHNNGQGRTGTSVARTNSGSNRSAGSATRGHRTGGTSQNVAASSARGTGTGSTNSTGVTPATMAAVHAQSNLSSSSSPYRYTYGTGSTARSYRAYGYGGGYRNRYYGSGYGYGRSQSVNRALVSRLRSVHTSLAQLDHDYQGHRVQAMRSIQMAVRSLSHRSSYGNRGYGNGMNNGLGMGNVQMAGNGQGMGNNRGVRRSALGGGMNGRQPMTQAQSDARMSQALRTLQGIGMQLGNQGSGSMGHSQAMGHVQRAANHLNVALSIR